MTGEVLVWKVPFIDRYHPPAPRGLKATRGCREVLRARAVSCTSSSAGRCGCATLCAPLSHMRSYVSNVCGSGRVPCSLNVMFLGWFCSQEPALTSERHTSTGTSMSTFTSAGGHRYNTREATPAGLKKRNVHSSERKHA